MDKKQPLYPHVPKNKVQRMPQTLDGNGTKDEIYLSHELMEARHG